MPYNSTLYSSPIASLPPQMVPKKRKTKEWGMACMDALEMIGRSQHTTNLKLIENYEMIKGQFIFRHYFDDEGYADMINQLTRELDIPSYLRHYDIISQVVNTLVNEWLARPDLFRVRGYSSNITNEYVRTKTDLIKTYVQNKINSEIDNKLIQMGLDPDRKDFKSPQEKEQYVKLVEEQKQEMTPPEIQQYMDMKWQHVAEIWGQDQLEQDNERYFLKEKEKKEFEDMLVSDRCFRHYYLTGNGYNQETWNPINTFFHKSPDVDYVEDGDYVGRVFYLTIADVIDRYGHLMDKSDIEALQGDVDFTLWKERDGYGIYYGSVVPYAGYPQHKVVMDTIGTNPFSSQGIPTLGPEFFANLHTDNYFLDTRGLVQVTEGYWKSQKKIGKVTYIDDLTGLKLDRLVDEDFQLPDGFKVIEGSIYDVQEPGTVVWTWVNESWQGVKINFSQYSNIDRDIYLNIRPVEFQFKGDNNPYGCKLPVCGQLFSVRNSRSMSLVDNMKADQIGHNIAMNQAYQIMEREYGRFLVMDVNMLPNGKDWGGERAYEKFMLIAKTLGMAPTDTSPQNGKAHSAAVVGGHGMQVIDLDETARIVSRLKIADAFEQRALRQVGFNNYRSGDYGASSTAEGVQQGVQASRSQTETYFINFSNYLRRCHNMNLEIAQYVQSQNEDITVTYTKSDMTRAFTKLLGTDLLLCDLGVYVSNSQENVRQLEMLRKLALENNTSGATIVDLASIITMNSPTQIKLQLEQSFKAQQQRTDRQFELEQQKIEQERELKQAELQNENSENDKDRQTKERVATIQALGRQKNGDVGGLSESLDVEKLNTKKGEIDGKAQVERSKQDLEREKFISEKEYNIRKLDLEEKRIEADQAIQREKIEVAKVLKGRGSSSKTLKKKK